jgi:hypothetical protein
MKNEELGQAKINEESGMKKGNWRNPTHGGRRSHSSFFILHSSFFILHSSFFILHSSSKITCS